MSSMHLVGDEIRAMPVTSRVVLPSIYRQAAVGSHQCSGQTPKPNHRPQLPGGEESPPQSLSHMSDGDDSFCDPFSDAEDDNKKMYDHAMNECPVATDDDGTSPFLPAAAVAAPAAHDGSALPAAAAAVDSVPPRLLHAADFCTVSSWSEDDEYDRGAEYRNGGRDVGCCQHSCSSSISSLGSPDVVELGNNADADAEVGGSANGGPDADDDLMMVFEPSPSDLLPRQDDGAECDAEAACGMMRRFGTNTVVSGHEPGRRRRAAPTVVSSTLSFNCFMGTRPSDGAHGAMHNAGYEGECDDDADFDDSVNQDDWESCDSVPTIEMDVEGCDGCSRAAADDDMCDGMPHQISVQHDYGSSQEERQERWDHHHHRHGARRGDHHHPFPQMIHTFPCHHHHAHQESNNSVPQDSLPSALLAEAAATPMAIAYACTRQQTQNPAAAPPRPLAITTASAARHSSSQALHVPQATTTGAAAVQSVHTVERHTKILHLVPPHRARGPPPPDLLTSLYLPDEMTTTITSYLDVPSLVSLRVTCSRMRDVASRDEAGWADACRRLWRGKANVCKEARNMMAASSRRAGKLTSENARQYGAMGSYRVSVRDAAHRDVLTTEELCYDASTEDGPGPVWSFRFKESAGPDWTGWDPWWNGGEARKMVFLRDGTVKQFVSRDEITNDEIGGQAERRQQPGPNIDDDDRIRDEDRARGYVLRPAFSDGDTVEVNPAARREGGHAHQGGARQDGARVAEAVLAPPPLNNNNGAAAMPGRRQAHHPRPRIDIRWRLVSGPMDMPHRPPGAYIRLTVGGRDVPTYVVRRSPTGNWGFLLESCWGLYASFDLPRRRVAEEDSPSLAPRDNGEGQRRGGSVPHHAVAAPADAPVAGHPPLPPPFAPTGPMGIPGARMRLRRTRYGGRWMNVDGIESEDEDYHEDVGDITYQGEDGGASLLDDAAMMITNGTQWREALLYNYGAVSLPDGNGAVEEFDRLWSDPLRLGRQRSNI